MPDLKMRLGVCDVSSYTVRGEEKISAECILVGDYRCQPSGKSRWVTRSVYRTELQLANLIDIIIRFFPGAKMFGKIGDDRVEVREKSTSTYCYLVADKRAVLNTRLYVVYCSSRVVLSPPTVLGRRPKAEAS